MTPLTAEDLLVVRWIQEAKSCTVAEAKKVYKTYATQLADPDVEKRHEIIWENVQRGEKISGVPENKEQAMADEKTKKARKKAAPKKKAAAKKKKPETESRPAIELAELTREVELTPTAEKHVYTALLFGKKHAVAWAEVGHDQGAKSRFTPPHLSESRFDSAIAYAKTNDLPVAVCVTIRISGRLDQGYAIPSEVFKKFITKMSRGRMSLSMSNEARAAYREGGWDDVKFSVAKEQAAAA